VLTMSSLTISYSNMNIDSNMTHDSNGSGYKKTNTRMLAGCFLEPRDN
jgi:hypothetical protein